MVDVKNHRDMVNPFEIASDAGTYLVMSGGAIFSRLEFSFDDKDDRCSVARGARERRE